ncbi:hypothetical protein MLD38_012575 [Melastoma candidum]|uniref:Uncharacterized protein n=1 Tax=Melastoma candidum TaxID=119954 RepID=A0ACB9R671_9MYRT|nr:hypothetical protein MLD38_012575 [Melastoma candidum]
MIPRVGSSAADLPTETQVLLVRVAGEGPPLQGTTPTYVLMLTVLDGPFRASLQGNSADELQLCVESGIVFGSQHSAFYNKSYSIAWNLKDTLYSLFGEDGRVDILGTHRTLDKEKVTFSHLEHKKCTWDAFYKDVSPKGIIDGLHWDGEPLISGTEFAMRLVDIKENSRFRAVSSEKYISGLHELIQRVKEEYGTKLVYMWHALTGYWGGPLPTSETLRRYNPRMEYPVQSPGFIANVWDIAMDSLEKYSVDVQNVLETLGNGYGGRVSLTRVYQKALELSIRNNFKNNNVICSMCHNTDSIYSFKQSATARASEDFMPKELTLQTLHIASVAYNSLFLGEVVVPDWDMYGRELFLGRASTTWQSFMQQQEQLAVVQYIDKPCTRDFEILKGLVLPDGSILRAKFAGRPTQDCLFSDPVMDGKRSIQLPRGWNLALQRTEPRETLLSPSTTSYRWPHQSH